ncbi:hypothetical protein B0S90_1931 [Caldicellulosiruptor bescii]|uniref:Pyridinium-3,5-bisthiocarboxylic acid mononucleotide nickel insertion protein n=2 Tax=Caldicellulosiruptor bescii TaxID=31899 RepID=B9MK71_CALBD|nr:nickel pincer cofactor biosynthesis protein LarC [Caldicellulosiruptor bescii]ACM60729.1 protein of unknown function DUF111 [Caldicellulosiruptor bescii DSM 6725]PBC89456.1 hypothetical protein B0S87_2556 [Caldicellulosiruptor bescii]PBC91059.1 hypothetical protein B0S89_1432 [Caldicellulosiruptor bescii]PBD03527.1 hypothetical protein B0S85_1134 [Caldicellulosiruptor bescii]PBD06858.1 hypothetical protein B0S90_1931 [Caldicellulosiruptor bescii]
MILYFDAISGLAGDMLVASLIDCGVDFEYIKSAISLLKLDVELSVEEKFVNGIKAKRFIVNTQSHEHDHHSDSTHHHRTFKDIKKMLIESSLPEAVKEMSIKIFEKIALAEAKVHGKNPEEISFHEVGADDSIVDIVAFSLCIDNLKPEKIVFSPLCDGRGFTKSMHGIIPVPAPAVLEIARQNGIPLSTKDIESELITPTGIGIAAAVASSFSQMPNMTIEKIGYGAGTKELPIPNVVRAIVGKKKLNFDGDYFEIFANVDDMTGEELSLAFEKIMQSGALDVYFTPIFMKKGRPAYKIGVITKAQNFEDVASAIFRWTSTIGIRFVKMQRIEMERQEKRIQDNPELRLKISSYEDIKRIKLEFEDIKKLTE